MEWQVFFEEVFISLKPVLSLLVAYLLVALARFITAHTDNVLLKKALENLEKIILSTIMSLMQTTVSGLKANNMDGRLTEEEAQEVKFRAIAIIKEQLQANETRILEKNFGNIDTLIDNVLEQKVLETKMRRGMY